MIKISVDKQSELSVIDSIRAMTLPPKRRTRMLQAAGKGSVQTSRKNQRAQKTPQGKSWDKRANKSRKRMQVRLAKYLAVKSFNENEAVIGWRKRSSGQVAAKHHVGHRQRHTRASAIKALRNGNRSAG